KARNSGPKTATGRSTRSSSTRSSSRPRRISSRSASSAAGARSTTSSSTKKPARSRRSRVNSGSPPQADGGSPGNNRADPGAPGAESSPPPRRRGHRRHRLGHALSEPDRAAAAGGSRQRSLFQRLERLLEPGHLAAGDLLAGTDGDLLADR